MGHMSPQELGESLAARSAGGNEDVQYVDVREVGAVLLSTMCIPLQAAVHRAAATCGAGCEGRSACALPCSRSGRRARLMHQLCVISSVSVDVCPLPCWLQEREEDMARLPHFQLLPLSR